MNKIALIVIFLVCAFPIMSQKDSNAVEIDTLSRTEISIRKIIFNKKEKPKKNSKVVFDNKYPTVDFSLSVGLGVAGLSQLSEEQTGSKTYVPTSTASIDLDYGKCRNFVINGDMWVNFNKNLGMLTGLGFEFNRYMFKDKLIITSDEGQFIKDSTEYDYYRFRTDYIQIPLMFTLRSKNENLWLAIGGSFSYNIGNKIKNKYSLNNAEYKTSIKGNYNVAPYKISLGARLYYKAIGLYFNYGMTKMNDNQVETQEGVLNLIPFSAGITFVL